MIVRDLGSDCYWCKCGVLKGLGIILHFLVIVLILTFLWLKGLFMVLVLPTHLLSFSVFLDVQLFLCLIQCFFLLLLDLLDLLGCMLRAERFLELLLILWFYKRGVSKQRWCKRQYFVLRDCRWSGCLAHELIEADWLTLGPNSNSGTWWSATVRVSSWKAFTSTFHGFDNLSIKVKRNIALTWRDRLGYLCVYWRRLWSHHVITDCSKLSLACRGLEGHNHVSYQRHLVNHLLLLNLSLH